MKIATWNVNSIRARTERLLSWLASRQPDVLCLQETKVTDDLFPFDLLREAGYEAVAHGQKTYNGVAILSRLPPAEVQCGFPAESGFPEARLITALVEGIRLVNVYVPNGHSVGSEKYTYKLAWMQRLRRFLDERFDPSEPVLLCGDLNVAPEERDVARPDAWRGTVLFHPEVRAALEEVRAFGFVDALRLHHQEEGIYSWWDYRALSFPKNDGLRIDHVFVTPPLAARCTGVYVDREERKGPKASDHAPVVALFD